jgi:type VI secretion system protein VasD
MISRQLTVLLASAVLLNALSACASKPAKPLPVHEELSASADVNPDASGRASPIVIRVFQLRNDGEFASADFFALYDKEKETLASSFISREEYVLAPGETRKLDLAVNADARVIGVLAAFRDIRAAQWRAVSRPPEKKLTHPHLLGKGGITVHVGKDAVTLAVKD